ncbi:MAG: YlxR family protein [Oscillospiraceae bacterium]|nr:YlxR family protein [Oscillospiraceae bacterium]
MKTQPQRSCVACGVSKNKNELIRVVRSPGVPEEPEICIDLKGKKNGRGAYICPDEECLKKALKTRKLEKNLKTKITDEFARSLLEHIACGKQ